MKLIHITPDITQRDQWIFHGEQVEAFCTAACPAGDACAALLLIDKVIPEERVVLCTQEHFSPEIAAGLTDWALECDADVGVAVDGLPGNVKLDREGKHVAEIGTGATEDSCTFTGYLVFKQAQDLFQALERMIYKRVQNQGKYDIIYCVNEAILAQKNVCAYFHT